MTDPEADTRGVEPLDDDGVDDLIDNLDPPLLALQLRSRIDAEVANRREWEQRADKFASVCYEQKDRADVAEAEVQRLTRERDEAQRTRAKEARRAWDAECQVEVIAADRFGLLTEVQRLRAALERIVALADDPDIDANSTPIAIAAAALDREGEATIQQKIDYDKRPWIERVGLDREGEDG